MQLSAEVDCTKAGISKAAMVHVTVSGYPDYELRETAREAKQHRASLPLVAARFRPTAGAFVLEKQTASSIAALDKNFTWDAEGAFIGIFTPTFQGTNASSTYSLRAPFWLPKEWDLALHHRQTALFLNQGYPLTLEEEINFSLPTESQIAAMPSTAENRNGPLRWQVEWVKGREGQVTGRLRAELAKGELSPTETVACQEALKNLLTAAGSEVRVAVRR